MQILADSQDEDEVDMKSVFLLQVCVFVENELYLFFRHSVAPIQFLNRLLVMDQVYIIQVSSWIILTPSSQDN